MGIQNEVELVSSMEYLIKRAIAISRLPITLESEFDFNIPLWVIHPSCVLNE